MLKSELIAKLQEIEGDYPVKIFDHRKSALEASGDPSSEGIHEVDPYLMDQWSDMSEEEKKFYIEEYETEIKPWIALSFTNPEFDVYVKCGCGQIYECADTISVGNKSICPSCNCENNTVLE